MAREVGDVWPLDLKLNHNRAVAKAYVQTVADAVAAERDAEG